MVLEGEEETEIHVYYEIIDLISLGVYSAKNVS